MKKAYGVVSKGNGECFLMAEKHTSLSVGGGQAGQGFPCVMVLWIVDTIGGQNEHVSKGDVCGTLKQSHHKNPPVLMLVEADDDSYRNRQMEPGVE